MAGRTGPEQACLSRIIFGFALECSSGVIALDLAGAMEDQHDVAGIVMLPDVGFDIMIAERARRDSQRHTLVADCVARPGDHKR